MNFDESDVTNTLGAFGQGLTSWLASLDRDAVLLSLLFVGLVYLLRGVVARVIVGGLRLLLKHFSVAVSKEVLSYIAVAAGALVVVAAAFLVLDNFNLGPKISIFAVRILHSIATIAVFGTWYRLSGAITAFFRRESPRDPRLEEDWIVSIVKFAILLFGITALLDVWQVDISGALTGVGVLGAGIAIAAQDLVRNLVAGMTNMSEERFETGDTIEIKNRFIGTVKKIDLRSTLVVGFDQIPRQVPNSDLANSVVLNYTEMQHRRVMLSVQLVLSSTQEQIEAVRDGLRDYLKTSGDFDLGVASPKYVYVNEFGPSSVDILFYAVSKGPCYDEYLQVTEGLTLEILRLTRSAGTSLAFPTRTIRLDSDAAADFLQPDQTPVAT